MSLLRKNLLVISNLLESLTEAQLLNSFDERYVEALSFESLHPGHFFRNVGRFWASNNLNFMVFYSEKHNDCILKKNVLAISQEGMLICLLSYFCMSSLEEQR